MNELFFTIPDGKTLAEITAVAPEYMRPVAHPHAVVWEAALSEGACQAILDDVSENELYKHPSCGASTREAARPLSNAYNPVRKFAEEVNRIWWNFDLDDDPGAWLQSYSPGTAYPIHSDTDLGQSRKLTVIALLSEEYEYADGDLILIPYPEMYPIPKTKGTMVVFPSWLLHEVRPVTSGLRQTLNLGYWGPPFR